MEVDNFKSNKFSLDLSAANAFSRKKHINSYELLQNVIFISYEFDEYSSMINIHTVRRPHTVTQLQYTYEYKN